MRIKAITILLLCLPVLQANGNKHRFDGPKNEVFIYLDSNQMNPNFNQMRSGFFEIKGINTGVNISRTLIKGKFASISILSGFNYRSYKIQFKPNLDFYPNLKDPITVSRGMLGLNLGFSIDKPIIKHNKFRLYIGIGAYVTQTLLANNHGPSFYYDIPNSSDKNYVIFDFNKNTLIYPYPFFKLKVNQTIKGKYWLYGIKCNIGNDFSIKTNIDYRAVLDFASNPNETKGTFKDLRNQWEVFLGINF